MLTEKDLDYKLLKDILCCYNYSLGLSPGFFRFYALTGVLSTLQDYNSLSYVTHLSGSSAGALVSGFYASGLLPNDMINILLTIKREDIWDIGGIGGLLQGNYFHKLLEKYLKVSLIEDCKIPYGATAYDIIRLKTNCIHKGCLASTIRASCTFPGLFQPVIINSTPHIDGGVFDDSGLMALPGIPETKLIVNIVCGEGREASSKHPKQFPDALLLTIVLRNIPMVSPFTMSTTGPLAFRLAKEATIRALNHSRVIPVGPNHWVSHIDAHIFHIIPSTITIKNHHHNHHHDNHHDQHYKREYDEINLIHEDNNNNINHELEHKEKRRKKVSIGPIEEVEIESLEPSNITTHTPSNIIPDTINTHNNTINTETNSNSLHKQTFAYRLAKLKKRKVHKKFHNLF